MKLCRSGTVFSDNSQWSKASISAPPSTVAALYSPFVRAALTALRSRRRLSRKRISVMKGKSAVEASTISSGHWRSTSCRTSVAYRFCGAWCVRSNQCIGSNFGVPCARRDVASWLRINQTACRKSSRAAAKFVRCSASTRKSASGIVSTTAMTVLRITPHSFVRGKWVGRPAIVAGTIPSLWLSNSMIATAVLGRVLGIPNDHNAARCENAADFGEPWQSIAPSRGGRRRSRNSPPVDSHETPGRAPDFAGHEPTARPRANRAFVAWMAPRRRGSRGIGSTRPTCCASLVPRESAFGVGEARRASVRSRGRRRRSRNSALVSGLA